MRRVVVSVLSALTVCGMCLTGCGDSGGSAETTRVDKTALSEVKAGYEKLKGTDKYLIQNVLQAPDGKANFLEVIKKDCSYTEYPITDSGENDSESVVGDSATSYSLTDWLEVGGNMYVNQPSSQTSSSSKKDSKSDMVGSFYKMPKSYTELCQGRRTMYLDKVINSLTFLSKEKDTKKTDLGEGEETYTIYKGTIPASAVKEILGVGTKGLYDSIVSDYPKEKNIINLCKQYLEKLKMDLTFSDANVTIGIADGMVKQLSIETGGLGTRLYYTKTILSKLTFTEREKPDFKNCKDYIESMREVADYVANYGSYDEAMEALDSKTASGSAVTAE